MIRLLSTSHDQTWIYYRPLHWSRPNMNILHSYTFVHSLEITTSLRFSLGPWGRLEKATRCAGMQDMVISSTVTRLWCVSGHGGCHEHKQWKCFGVRGSERGPLLNFGSLDVYCVDWMIVGVMMSVCIPPYKSLKAVCVDNTFKNKSQ